MWAWFAGNETFLVVPMAVIFLRPVVMTLTITFVVSMLFVAVGGIVTPVVILSSFPFGVVVFISSSTVSSVVVPRGLIVPGVFSPVPFSIIGHFVGGRGGGTNNSGRACKQGSTTLLPHFTMAGHGFVKHDAAIERWNLMREDVYKHFRWSPRITAQVIGGMIVFPLTIYYIASKTDLRWKWTAKRKGESLNA